MNYADQIKLEFLNLTLTVFEETLTLLKFAPSESVPEAVRDFSFYSVSKIQKELSLACPGHLSIQNEKNNPN